MDQLISQSGSPPQIQANIMCNIHNFSSPTFMAVDLSPASFCSCAKKRLQHGHEKKTEGRIQTLTVSQPAPSLLFVPVNLLLFSRGYPPRTPYRLSASILPQLLYHLFVQVPPVGSELSATPLSVTYLLHWMYW